MFRQDRNRKKYRDRYLAARFGARKRYDARDRWKMLRELGKKAKGVTAMEEAQNAPHENAPEPRPKRVSRFYTFNYQKSKPTVQATTEPQEETEQETGPKYESLSGFSNETDYAREYISFYGKRVKPKNMPIESAYRLAGAIVRSTAKDMVNYHIAIILKRHTLDGKPIGPDGMRLLQRGMERADEQLRSEYYDLLTMGVGGAAIIKEVPRVAKVTIEAKYKPIRKHVARMIQKAGISPEDIMGPLELTREELADWLMYPFPTRVKAIKGVIKGKGQEVKDDTV